MGVYMANDDNAAKLKAEKKKLAEEKKKLKNDQQRQKKEAKKRAKEIAKKEDALIDEDEPSSIGTIIATLTIVVVWLAVIVVIIKLDVGGFGSKVLTPVLKDVPVINKILPVDHSTETTDPDSYGGYTNLREAVDYIKELELQLDRAQTKINTQELEITDLKANVLRLQEFEKKQVEFQRIKTEFFEEVVYAEKGPGAEEYKKFYEAMDPTTAEFIYRQVVVQLEESKEIQDYAATYARMKPKQAAGIFESMTDDLSLVARILRTMSAEDRGAILGVMDSEVAAKVTKLLDPEN